MYFSSSSLFILILVKFSHSFIFLHQPQKNVITRTVLPSCPVSSFTVSHPQIMLSIVILTGVCSTGENKIRLLQVYLELVTGLCWVTVKDSYTLLLLSSNATFFHCYFLPTRSAPLTFQALSDEDRRLWLDAMDGKEPVGCKCLIVVLPAFIPHWILHCNNSNQEHSSTGSKFWTDG